MFPQHRTDANSSPQVQGSHPTLQCPNPGCQTKNTQAGEELAALPGPPRATNFSYNKGGARRGARSRRCSSPQAASTPPAHNEHPRHLPGCTELREAQGTGLYRAPQARYYRHWGSSPSAVPHRGSYRSPGRVPPVPSLPFPSILGVSTGPLRAHPRPPSTVPGLASAPPAQLRDPTGNHRAGPIPERRHRGSRPRSPLTTEALPVPVQPAAGQKSRPGGRGTEA